MSHQYLGSNARVAPAASAAARWLEEGRIPCLDGMRALAILLVLYCHAEAPWGDHPVVHAVKSRCGFLGVQLFFVLSGFLITTLMQREVARTGRLSLRGFYWRRFLRIVPAYLAFLAALGVLQALGQAPIHVGDWLSLATYSVNFRPPPLPWQISHVWSLSVEEHFYLLWPPIVAAWPPLRCQKALVGCIAACLGLRWLLLLALPAWAGGIDVWTFTRIDDVAVGCLLAFLARDPAARIRLSGLVADRRRLILLVAAFLAAQLLGSRAIGGELLPSAPLCLVIGAANLVNALCIAALMWAILIRPDGACGKALSHPVAVWVGVLSYSLYLWHPLFCGHAPDMLRGFPQNYVCMFLAAGLSYALVERPFLYLGARAAFRGAGRRSPQPGGKGEGLALIGGR
jgi:peptidoglycan/LPS O-acetylase OafA/YrhL